MKVEAQCKICKKKLELEFDDDYALAGDPLKLKRLAVCDRCGDYTVERREVYYRLKKIAERLLSRDTTPELVTELLQKLVRQYLKLHAEYARLPVPEEDPSIVDAIISKPRLFDETLRRAVRVANQRDLAL